MKKLGNRIYLGLLLLVWSIIGHAQVVSPGVIYVSSAPTGTCSAAPPIEIVSSTGVSYTCNNGMWGANSGGAASALPSYYVDNIGGSDSNNGTSIATPFASVSHAETVLCALTSPAGKIVALKVGDEFHETLTTACSGTINSPLTYTSYGSGTQPIISASDNLTGSWTQGAGLPAQETCSGTNIFCSGMETTSFSNWGTVDQTGGTVAQSTVQVAHGSFSAAMTGNGTDNRMGLVTPAFTAWTTSHTYYIRTYIYLPSASLSGSSGNLKIFQTSAGSYGQITCSSAGCTNIGLVGGAGGTFVNNVSTSALTLNAWHYIEFDWTVSASVGGAVAFIDGVQQFSTLNVNTSADAGTTTVEVGNQAFGGPIVNGGTIYFDDYQDNTAGPIGAFNTGGAFPATVWSHAQSTTPYLPSFNGVAGTSVSSLGAVSGPNQYYWNGSSTLYVYSGQNPASIVEIPARANAVTDTGSHNYRSFVNVGFQGSQADLVYLFSAQMQGWVFQNDTFRNAYSVLLASKTGTPPSLASGPTVLNSKFYGAGGAGIVLNDVASTGATITGNEVWNVCNINTGSGENQFCDGIDLYGDSSAESGAGSKVYYNYIHDIGIGASGSYGGGLHADTTNGVDYEYNLIENINGNGLYLEKSTAVGGSNTFKYNTVLNGGLTAAAAAIAVRAGDGTSFTGGVVTNNTAISTAVGWGCRILIDNSGGAVTLTNLTFSNNICTANPFASGVTFNFVADTGYNGTGDTYPTNNFGSAATNFVNIASTDYNTYGALPALFSTSVSGAPLFVNTAIGNYAQQAASPTLGIGAAPVYQPAFTLQNLFAPLPVLQQFDPYGAAQAVQALIPSPATVAPLIDGSAAVGTSLLFARQDHVHPTDTTRAAKSVSNAITSATAGSGISAVTCTTAACTNLRGTYTMSATAVSAGATILTLVWPTTTTAYACIVSQDGGTIAIAPSHSVATATGMTIASDLAITSGSVGIDYSCQP